MEQEHLMPEYRAYVLDEHDHILFPIEIVEEDLSAAVHLGLEVLHNAQWGELYPGAQYIELWQGDTRVFPPQKPDSQSRSEGRRDRDYRD
jgi:hypothetical protein